MAEFEFSLTAAPKLGVDWSKNGNRIVERDDLAVVSIATPLGADAEVAKALKSGWKLDYPEPTMSSTDGTVRAIRSGADQMLLLFPHSTPDANQTVQSKINGAGYTTDQTDSWVVLEISGPDTMDALARLCPLDLDENVFPEGSSGRTVMEHMGAFVIRLGPKNFLLMSASSSAGSFLHAVETSYLYTIA